MEYLSSAQVTQVRAASRSLVRELGFLNKTIAGTTLSASAVHAIVEIGTNGRLSAKDLSTRLLLEKSTVSRLVANLIDRGDLAEDRSSEDGRRKHLRLTSQGDRTFAEITRFAQRQVCDALAQLDAPARRSVLVGLETYAGALRQSRTADPKAPQDATVRILQGYTPCLVARIVEMHAAYYSRQHGFGAVFEAKIAGGLADFVERLEEPGNQIWRAERDGRIVGSIAIDGGYYDDDRGLLRWFIVEENLRGAGIGRELVGRAVTFCDEQGFAETDLWTFKGLDAARRLYESHGFALAEEAYGTQWGTKVVEQRFRRPLHT